jgi:SAM-dependent methyltransferase
MSEVGVDISRHTSKALDSLADQAFDYVVTVCGSAHESCPALAPRRGVIHVGFDDPPRLARDARTDDEAMPYYRRVRDEIRRFIETLPHSLRRQTMTPGTPVPASARTCCSESCCATPPSSTSGPADSAAHPQADLMRDKVREGYAKIARGGSCGASGGGCCGAVGVTPARLAEAIGYSGTELAATPDGANMGLSCGNPTAIASLRPGEVVLDLGAGGGFDCFIAGSKVGPTGRVIGVDMTPDMLTKARANIASYRAQTGLDNVEFRLGEIESLPLADSSVDVVISNCVLNLSPDKPRVWREIARVLKPGGRVAVSDLALFRPLPESVRSDVEALIGCIAGAVLVEEIHAMAAAAGFTDIRLSPKREYIEAMTSGEDPLYRSITDRLPAGASPADFITSLDIEAVRK